tara:strand:- start:322 stop:723 length:402 start_codon:yes stop_codon:yes gene_type:complete
MNFFLKIKKCPCCNSVNIFRTNGVSYKNNFKSLEDWTLKKIIVCRKCRIEFGLFINNKITLEKIVWMDMIKCEDNYLDELNRLHKNKEKYKEKNKELKYIKTIKEIENVLNKIRLDQIKIKVKIKIQNKSMLA